MTSYMNSVHPQIISQRKYDCLEPNCPRYTTYLSSSWRVVGSCYVSKLHDSLIVVSTLDIIATIPYILIWLLRVGTYCLGMYWLDPIA